MPSIRASRAAARPMAILVRVTAFVVAAVSVIVIPTSFAAAASGHVAAATAFATTGAAAGLSLVTSLAARGLDPMRG